MICAGASACLWSHVVLSLSASAEAGRWIHRGAVLSFSVFSAGAEAFSSSVGARRRAFREGQRDELKGNSQNAQRL